MSKQFFNRAVAGGMLVVGGWSGAFDVQAQASSVTVYGTLDQYLNYMKSSSGAKVKSLEDGAYLRSRLGFRGVEDLGGGLSAKFQLEHGLSADTGGQADGTRMWDRQAWVGLATPYGEFRLGRQNSPTFVRGGHIDFTARTLGSVINAFGVPTRFDNTLGYSSPRMAGVQVDLQTSLPETATGNRPVVYQWGADWTNGTWVAGYAGMRARPPANAAVSEDVVYDNLFGNWNYGKGKVYLAFVRSNNSTASAVSNNAGTILGNVGGFNAGTNPDLNRFYHVWQVSADYAVTGQLRVGALWGQIDDRSGRDRGATGVGVGAYYDLSKRTTLVALANQLRNDRNGGWRPSGSAGLKTTFTTPGDINGRRIDGLQVGVVHRF
jgi:predicted porin